MIWLGDMNYRIDGDRDDILEFIAKGKIDALQRNDQLNKERTQQPMLYAGFCEGPIDFYPTYKYTPGSTEYQGLEGKKLRAPAWCDRILFRSTEDEDVVRHALGGQHDETKGNGNGNGSTERGMHFIVVALLTVDGVHHASDPAEQTQRCEDEEIGRRHLNERLDCHFVSG